MNSTSRPPVVSRQVCCFLMALLTWTNVSSLIVDWSHTVNKLPDSLIYCKQHHWRPISPCTVTVQLQPTPLSLSLRSCVFMLLLLHFSFWALPTLWFTPVCFSQHVNLCSLLLLLARCLSLTGTTNWYCFSHSLTFSPFHLCFVLCVMHDRCYQVNIGLWLGLHLSVPLCSCHSFCSHQAGSCGPNHNLICWGK